VRIKFKLYTDENGDPQVKVGNPDMPSVQPYWRADGQFSFLQVMADDPDCPLEELEEGVYFMPKEFLV
jgi:hypothetical protein